MTKKAPEQAYAIKVQGTGTFLTSGSPVVLLAGNGKKKGGYVGSMQVGVLHDGASVLVVNNTYVSAQRPVVRCPYLRTFEI